MSMEYKEALKVVQENVERLGELKEACEEIMTLYDVAENSYQEGLEDGQMLCAMKWIPCSKKQPEVTGYYITTIKYYSCEDVFKYEITKGFYDAAIKKWNNGLIIAWMPLPDPYEERNNE